MIRSLVNYKNLLYSIHLITNTGIFVNGIGGCGKSHIILTIYDYCELLNLKCVILTPTANSAQLFKNANPTI